MCCSTNVISNCEHALNTGYMTMSLVFLVIGKDKGGFTYLVVHTACRSGDIFCSTPGKAVDVICKGEEGI